MLKGFFNVPKPVNEPVLSYAPGSPERAELQAMRMRKQQKLNRLEAQKRLQAAKNKLRNINMFVSSINGRTKVHPTDGDAQYNSNDRDTENLEGNILAS